MKVEDVIKKLKILRPDFELHPDNTVNFLMILCESLKLSDRNIHILRHKELHKAFDELIADMMQHTGRLPSKTSVRQLMEWSNSQTENPTETT
jgi:hypothetical protein